MKYIIGIIDEEQDQVANIRRTIKYNKPKNVSAEDLEIIEYPLEGDSQQLPQSLSKKVIDDIISERIHLLIIDYRIISDSALIEGSDIYRIIHNTVPKFPVIILTNVPNDCYPKEFIDADKVYYKAKFFKLQEGYAQEKTANMFRNIDHYIKQRAKLSVELVENVQKLQEEAYSVENLQSVLNIENALSDFYPQQQTELEKSLDVSDLRTAVSLLEEAKGMLGDSDED